MRGNPADPQSFNRYPYVRNSPVNFTDPTGRLAASAVFDDWICDYLGDPFSPGGFHLVLWNECFGSVDGAFLNTTMNQIWNVMEPLRMMIPGFVWDYYDGWQTPGSWGRFDIYLPGGDISEFLRAFGFTNVEAQNGRTVSSGIALDMVRFLENVVRQMPNQCQQTCLARAKDKLVQCVVLVIGASTPIEIGGAIACVGGGPLTLGCMLAVHEILDATRAIGAAACVSGYYEDVAKCYRRCM